MAAIVIVLCVKFLHENRLLKEDDQNMGGDKITQKVSDHQA